MKIRRGFRPGLSNITGKEQEMKKNKKLTYYLAIYPDATGLYWTKFADFDCLADQGKTPEDAVEQSTAFLDAVVEDMINHNKPLPEASTITDFRKKLDPADGEPLCIVPVTVYPPAKTERINITGKGDVFARIDDYAKRHHLTRSELMIGATLDYIRANA